MRGIRPATFWTMLALVVGQFGFADAGRRVQDPGVPEHIGPGDAKTVDAAGDMQHVAQRSFPVSGTGLLGSFTGGGSDIEFARKRVVKLTNGATGDPVCTVRDETQDDGCARDENGNPMYEYEDRDFAIAGRLRANAFVFDITDPRNPVKVGEVPCAFYQNDIQVQDDILLVASDDFGTNTCRRPDGSVVQSFYGSAVIDFSNPRAPQFVSRILYPRGSHNHTIHPTKPLAYLSDSDTASTGLGNIPIWDFSNPAAPVLRSEFKLGAHSPHDITFNADGTRAYVAAVSFTYILNTEDPVNPTVVSIIPNEGISISHQADPTPDGEFLLVSDELGGGAAGVSPGGPIHVYDISVEARPVKVAVIWNDCLAHSVSCGGSAPNNEPISTAHVFRINPDGYTMAIAWYKDGVHVLDYSGLAGANPAGAGTVTNLVPRTIGRMTMPGANTWAAKMWQERHPGYVFATDMARGLDVFYVSSLDNGFLATATIRGGLPSSTTTGGVTEKEFVERGCAARPKTQGLDGYVIRNLPAGLAGERKAILAASSPANDLTDLTIWYYNANCRLMGLDPWRSGDPIPEGAKHMVINGLGGAAVSVIVRTAPLGAA